MICSISSAGSAHGRQAADERGFEDDPPPRLFVTDRAAERQLRLARQRLDAGETADAVTLARLALDAGFDSVLESGAPAERTAAEFLEGFDAEQRRTLELSAGADAAALLDAAAARRDRAAVAAVAARFPGTAAGTRAAARLADDALDRGRFAEAARRFDALAALPYPTDADRDRWRVKASAARLRAGDRAAAADRLAAIPGDRRAVAVSSLLGEPVTAIEPGTVLDRFAGPGPRGDLDGDWPVDGRTDRRLPVAAAGGPAAVNLVGGPAWKDRTLAALPPTAIDGPPAALAARVRAERRAGGESLLPAPRPLAVGGRAIVQTPAGPVARDAATGELLWKGTAPADSALALVANTEGDPAGVSALDRGRGTVTGVRLLYEGYAYRDRAAGSLAADADRVYSVQNLDLPKLPPPGEERRFGMGRPNNRNLRERSNRLLAHDLRTGRLLWAAGGPGAAGGNRGAGGFFLGPPLPTAYGLAAVQEAGGVLRLILLDPADGTVRRSVPLAVPFVPLYDPPPWRTAGLQIAEAAGLWIVPTGSGGTIAYDPAADRFAWAYRYRTTNAVEENRPRRGMFFLQTDSSGDGRGWHDGLPKVAGDRVLLTPSDSDALHCLALADGAELWTRPRGDARQLAGAVGGSDGTLLLVEDGGVRGVSPADGADRWFTPLPAPAGAAVVAGERLIVPLSDGTLAAVRPADGGVAARVDAGGAAGNLIAAGGRLIAQTAGAVAAFPTAAEIDARLDSAGADDPRAALLRAGLAVQSGEPAAAVDELLAAASATGTAAGEAERRLAALLTAGLRRDFEAFRPLAERVRAATGRAPRGAVARAFAAGLVEAGEPVAAFETLATLRDAADADGSVRSAAAAHARPRLVRLYDGANGDQRRAMAGAVRAAYERIEATDAAGAEAFARRFGRLTATAAWRRDATPPAGAADLADAALRSAAAGADDPIAAERLWLWAAGRPGAAPAGADLAALYETAGDAEASRFLDPSATENPADPPWAGRSFEVEDVDSSGPAYVAAEVPVSRFPPWAVGGRLTAGEATGELRWQRPDGRTAFAHPLRGRFGRLNNRAAWSGHLLAAAVGDRLLVLDTLREPGTAAPLWQTALAQPSGGRTRLSGLRGPARALLNAPGTGGRAAAGPAVTTPRQIVVRSGSELAARHPLTGETFWTRDGFGAGSRVCGDDRVVLVLPPDGDAATLLSADDGSELGEVPAPPAADRWMERGSRVWTATGDLYPSLRNARTDRRPPGAALVSPVIVGCTDLAPANSDDPAGPLGPPREAWTRSFPVGTKFHVDDAATELAALAPDRRLTVFDLETGADRLVADLPPGPAVAEMWCLRSPVGWDVIAAEQSPGGAGRRSGEASDLLACGFEDRRADPFAAFEGPPAGPVWFRPTTAKPDRVWQPPGFPLLTLAGERSPGRGLGRGGRQSELLLLDRRNGAAVASRASLAAPLPVELRFPPGAAWTAPDRPVVLRTPAADLALKLGDAPPADPVREGVDEPAPGPPGGS